MGHPTYNMAGTVSKTANGTANGSPSSAAAKFDLPSHFIGGNQLGVAPPGKVKDFVAAHGGHTVITNVSRPSSIPKLGVFNISDCSALIQGLRN